MPWITRITITSTAPVVPVLHVSDRPIDATVKMAKPALYINQPDVNTPGKDGGSKNAASSSEVPSTPSLLSMEVVKTHRG
jgi:hypothetical protein